MLEESDAHMVYVDLDGVTRRFEKVTGVIPMAVENPIRDWATWNALKHVPDWRWMLDRADSPWYPTMRLYRQTVRDDWDGVFDRVAADVAKASAALQPESATLLPGSTGTGYELHKFAIRQ